MELRETILRGPHGQRAIGDVLTDAIRTHDPSRREMRLALLIRKSETVPLLIQRLSTTSDKEKHDLLMLIHGQLRWRELQPVILQLLRDTTCSEQVRGRAATALALLQNEEAVPDIRALLKTAQEDQVRRWAAMALATLGDQESLPEIESLLLDPAPLVQVTAAMALGMLGSDAGLEHALALTHHEFFGLRCRAAEALSHIGTPPALARLLEMQSTDTSPAVRGESGAYLGEAALRALDERAALDRLKGMLDPQNPDPPRWAFVYLAEHFAHESLPFLRYLADTQSPLQHAATVAQLQVEADIVTRPHTRTQPQSSFHMSAPRHIAFSAPVNSSVFDHGASKHREITAKAAALQVQGALAVPTFTPQDEDKMADGSEHEDKVWVAGVHEFIRFRHHHWNPLTNARHPFPVALYNYFAPLAPPGFVLLLHHLYDAATTNALDRSRYLWANKLVPAFQDPALRHNSDESLQTQGSLHAFGRVLHMLQDMSSPPHVHAPDGHGWVLPQVGPGGSPFGYYSDFEELWCPSSEVHNAPYYAPLWEFPDPAGGPLTPTDAITASMPIASKLDGDSLSWMRGQLSTIPPSERTTIEGYMKAQAWITYIHTSFYGQINYDPNKNYTAPETTGSGRTSILRRIFTEPQGTSRISFHDGWDNYWTIDGVGYYDKMLQYFTDDWWPCPGPYPLGSVDQGYGTSRHIKGRFYIYLHYFERSISGHWTEAIPPNKWPNNDDNIEGKPLAQYFGEVLLPLSVRFCAGLMRELFPAPRLTYEPAISGPGPTVPVTVTWSPISTDAGSATRYKLQRSTNGGPWSDVTNWTTNTFLTEQLPAGRYRYRARSSGWFTQAQGGAIESAWSEPGHDCVVVINPRIYVISAWAHTNGSVAPSGAVYVTEGADQKFTAVPGGGYDVDRWIVDGIVEQTGGQSYTIANVQANHSLCVTFKQQATSSPITVTSPSGGETYGQGNRMYINWSWAGPLGARIRVELVKGGSVHTVICDNYSNSGWYTWDIPGNQPVGNNYRIRVSEVSGWPTGESAADFEITERIPPPGLIRLYTLNDLRNMTEQWGSPSYPRDGQYLLMNNIDAADTRNWNDGKGWKPIGNGSADYFRGTFDGQGFTIANLYVRRPDEPYASLFAATMDTATIKNVTVEYRDCYAEGYRNHGGLMRGGVGGIVGENDGLIKNCHVYADRMYVINGSRVGGIVGSNWMSGRILNCSVYGRTTITVRGPAGAPNIAGGIAGMNAGVIRWCSVRPDVEVDADYQSSCGDDSGGIAGWNDRGVILECASEARYVDAEYRCGGIVGQLDRGEVRDCLWIGGTVRASAIHGGVAGSCDASMVTTCYVSGSVTGGAQSRGSLIGRCSSLSVEQSLWNTDTLSFPPIGDGGCTVIGCEGRTTAQLRYQFTFVGWDFDNVWTIDEGTDFPRLRGVGSLLPAPSGVTASYGHSNGVHLSWDAVTYELAGSVHDAVYRVFRSESAGAGAPLSEMGGWQTARTFLDTTAAPGHVYYYWVKAAATINGARESEFGGYVAGSRTEPPVAAPTGVAASDNLIGFVLVQWDAVPNANYYRVYRASTEAGPKAALGDWQVEMSVADSSGAPNTTYYYWVTAAVNAQGERESDFGGPDTGLYRLADLTAPTVSIEHPGNMSSVCPSPIEVYGTANDPGDPSSGIALVELQVNGGAWQPASGTVHWSASVELLPGINSISARSKDGASNYSGVDLVWVTLHYPTWCRDADGDGYGDPGDRQETCEEPVGYVADCRDCDDTDPNMHPGALELCDGRDNNCSGKIDDGGVCPAACCFEDGSCQELTLVECVAADGEYLEGVDCTPNPCEGPPQPTGACCFPDGTCKVRTQAECSAAGGTYRGNNTTCTPNPCPQPTGACCFPDGTCKVRTQAECSAAGGTYRGNNTTCTLNPCPQPIGACFLTDGACEELSEADCIRGRGDWQGMGTACEPSPQPEGACCIDDECQMLTPADCAAAGGAYRGGNCTASRCVVDPPTGACCFDDGTCTVLTAVGCAFGGGTYQGDNTRCTAHLCEPELPRWYRDADGDRYGNPAVWVEAAQRPAGYVNNNTDCDDTDPTAYPGAPVTGGIIRDCTDPQYGQSVPAPNPVPNVCGANLCGPLPLGAVPLTFLGLCVAKLRIAHRQRRSSAQPRSADQRD